MPLELVRCDRRHCRSYILSRGRTKNPAENIQGFFWNTRKIPMRKACFKFRLLETSIKMTHLWGEAPNGQRWAAGLSTEAHFAHPKTRTGKTGKTTSLSSTSQLRGSGIQTQKAAARSGRAVSVLTTGNADPGVASRSNSYTCGTAAPAPHPRMWVSQSMCSEGGDGGSQVTRRERMSSAAAREPTVVVDADNRRIGNRA
ncbi:hypothetical protein B0H14DRAFT_3742584 [Mycena olivaceomarginata]|nr:hypothetical protein B0H14DRAFT_3742584 [Mycena olivaceomarginata]